MFESGQASTLTAAAIILRQQQSDRDLDRTAVYWVWFEGPVAIRAEGELLAAEMIEARNPGARVGAVAKEHKRPRKITGRCTKCNILVFEDDGHADRRDPQRLICGDC